MTTAKDRREPATRDGAVRAGFRFSTMVNAGCSLLLRHSGLEQGRWLLVSSHDRIGFAVKALKECRGLATFGALAIWTGGRVDRFELVSDGPQTGKTGRADR